MKLVRPEYPLERSRSGELWNGLSPGKLRQELLDPAGRFQVGDRQSMVTESAELQLQDVAESHLGNFWTRLDYKYDSTAIHQCRESPPTDCLRVMRTNENLLCK